jgi:hypothetical protein
MDGNVNDSQWTITNVWRLRAFENAATGVDYTREVSVMEV